MNFNLLHHETTKLRLQRIMVESSKVSPLLPESSIASFFSRQDEKFHFYMRSRRGREKNYK